MFMKDPYGLSGATAPMSTLGAGGVAPLQQNGGTVGFSTQASGPSGFKPSKATSRIELMQIFDGAENDDNAFVLGILIAPPDTDGDVGLNHYVQMINDLTTIYDKAATSSSAPSPATSSGPAWAGNARTPTGATPSCSTTRNRTAGW